MIKKIGKVAFSSFLLGSLASAEPGLASRDLWFLPLGGEFQSTSEAEYRNEREEVEDVSTDYQSFTLGQGLTYSLSDDWVLGVKAQYKTQRESSGTSRSSTSGLMDPVFSVLYRVADQSYVPVFFDASFNLSPSFGKSRDNNVLRGSTKFDVKFDLGQDLYDWSYKFTAYTSWFSGEHYGANDSTIQSRFDLGLNGALQYNFDPEWAAFFELGILLPGKEQYNNDPYFEDADFLFTALVGPKYQFHRDLSAALQLFTKYEKGIIHVDPTEEYNFHTNTFGVNLALNYNF
jgi:hypothetical protein